MREVWKTFPYIIMRSRMRDRKIPKLLSIY